jgi:opacity protein-like surface antigen
MMKKIAMVLLCAIFSSGAYADNDVTVSKGFLGLEVGASMIQGDTFSELRHESTAAEFGLRLGAQTDEWRTMFTLNYLDSDGDDQNVERVSLYVDYFFGGENMDIMFKPFIGINVGYANYESTGIDSSDFIYGGQVGFVSSVTEEIDLDLSYRYSLSNSDSFDSMGSLTFGFNYFY